jgi:hypothetical protein
MRMTAAGIVSFVTQYSYEIYNHVPALQDHGTDGHVRSR